MSSRDVRLAPPALWGVFLSARVLLLSACSGAPAVAVRGSGDLGVVIERADGNVKVIETSGRSVLATVGGLGDLSHASVVFSRDGRYAFVFGRDGGLTKVDLLQAKVVGRVVQAGNAIGGSISHDGSLVVVQNYDPGGIKAFDANTLELVADVPATADDGTRSKVVGLAEAGGGAARTAPPTTPTVATVLAAQVAPRREKPSGRRRTAPGARRRPGMVWRDTRVEDLPRGVRIPSTVTGTSGKSHILVTRRPSPDVRNSHPTRR